MADLSEDDRPRRRSPQADALALFSVLWALAGAWHLLGNTTLAPAWAQALLAAGVVAVLLRPGAVVPLCLLAAAGVVLVWEEAPILGNHWLLAGFVDLAILVSAAVAAARRRFSDRTDMANRLFPAARLCLLGFYGFAAFAKLNTAFFDRSVSCAAYFFRESTSSLGLEGLQLGGEPWLERAVIVGTAATELAIPVLLVMPRTRRAGVFVALVFHALVALDRTHQFFDFSSVLLALFVLFLGPHAGTWVAERLGSVRARLALRSEQLPERAHLGLVAAVAIVLVLVCVDGLTPSTARQVGWWPWQVVAIGAIVATVRLLQQDRSPASVRLLPHHPLFLLVPLLVVVNGLTPYFEVKTGYGWNMYANLRTVDGDTNHLLLPATLPLTDEQADVVRIVESRAGGLQRYAEADYGLTWRQLRAYLAERPEVSITFERAGERFELDRASEMPELVEPVPEWRDKVQLFRAVDLTSPERCVPVWGPAR